MSTTDDVVSAEQPVAPEQAPASSALSNTGGKPTRESWWRKGAHNGAVAAIVVIVAGVFFTVGWITSSHGATRPSERTTVAQGQIGPGGQVGQSFQGPSPSAARQQDQSQAAPSLGKGQAMGAPQQGQTEGLQLSPQGQTTPQSQSSSSGQQSGSSAAAGQQSAPSAAGQPSIPSADTPTTTK